MGKGKKQLDDLLDVIANQAATQSNLSLNELVKIHNVLANSKEDRKNRAWIQIILLIGFFVNTLLLAYITISQNIGKLLFTNIQILHPSAHYIYCITALLYYLLNVIVKYHFPHHKDIFEKLWDKFFNKSSYANSENSNDINKIY